ncbi:hypothetical protein MAPG_08566 [Magnaporthiopsis poae ATCC 64411]|uniref:Uncharacterized protein n=1 Tax=Magnaporthiopsis poae (strain ATCC 64411 / 73-15) TaxID=644358 RepID=A0A0C4E7P7_MAGP6|nr:hypothetical protein MAPG_08566 [Magnaporthiopsis poae ATCC 64411]
MSSFPAPWVRTNQPPGLWAGKMRLAGVGGITKEESVCFIKLALAQIFSAEPSSRSIGPSTCALTTPEQSSWSNVCCVVSCFRLFNLLPFFFVILLSYVFRPLHTFCILVAQRTPTLLDLGSPSGPCMSERPLGRLCFGQPPIAFYHFLL